MKNKVKAVGCLSLLLTLIILEIVYKTNELTGWMMVLSIGFGWYSAKAIAIKERGARER